MHACQSLLFTNECSSDCLKIIGGDVAAYIDSVCNE